MITDADIERIVPGKTKVDTGLQTFVIHQKFFHEGEWRLVGPTTVWRPCDYKNWIILEPTLELTKLQPGKTILRGDINAAVVYHYLVIGCVYNTGILATKGVDKIHMLKGLINEVVYVPLEKCKTWTMVEEEG